MLDALQTLKAQLNAVPPEQNQYISPFWLSDESEFTVVLARRGRKRLAFPDEAASVDRRRPPKPATAPRIQALLTQARELQDRLNREPGLTRDALAKELGMAPPRLTHILNLLNLAPEIRERILALPPVAGLGPLTERRICER